MPPTRPSDSVTAELVRELTVLFSRMAILARPAHEEGHALTPLQRLALLELSAHEPLRLHELAARIGASAPTASRAVDGLLDEGLAERIPDPDDRRAVRIRLSDVGRTRLAERRARIAATLEPALATLDDDDPKRLVALLSELNGALSD